MTRSVLSTLLAIFVAIFSAQAQHTPANKFHPAPTPNGPARTNALGSRMTATSTYFYITDSTRYIIDDSNDYTYSGDRGGDALTAPEFDTWVSYRTINNTLRNFFRYTNTYSAGGDKQTTLMERTDNTGAYFNYTLTESIYNAGHMPTTDTFYNWDKTNSVWNVGAAAVYSYSATDKVLTKEYYTRPLALGWDKYPRTREIYTYDAGDKLTELRVQVGMGSNSVLDDYRIDTYTYNAGGQLTSWEQKTFDGSGNLSTDNIESYTVNAAGEVTLTTYFAWDIMANQMNEYMHTTHTYDANHNEVEAVSEIKDMITMIYTNTYREQYTYNSYNQRTSVTGNKWNSTTSTWEPLNDSYKYYYYYKQFFPSSVAQLPQQGGTLQLYPVPANNTLNVSINWKEAQSYTLTIADMQGRINMQYNSNNANEAINISALPAGVYNIILKGDKGGVQHSKFSVVR